MKPKVICHMLSSLDARVDLSGWSEDVKGVRDDQVALYFELHRGFSARGYIVGRVTMEPYAAGAPREPRAGDSAERPVHRAAGADRPLAIVLDPSGRLHWESGMLDGEHLVMVLGPDIPDNHLCELAERGLSYIVSDRAEIDPAWLIDRLAEEFGAELLMVEGGGVVNGHFLNADVVDEISLLVVPALDGNARARNVFDCGETSLRGRLRLSLLSADTLRAGTIHLRYAVETL